MLGASATVMWHRQPDYYLSRPWRGSWGGGGGGLMMNQAIHTVDLLRAWSATSSRWPAAPRPMHSAEAIEVEDTAEFAALHRTTARAVSSTPLSPILLNAPVTLDISTEAAAPVYRGDLTVTRSGDGRSKVVPERADRLRRRISWGVSHALLISSL